MNLHALAEARADAGNPVKVALIGAGKFGSMFLAQVPTMAGVEVAVIADLQKQLADARARSGEQTTLLQKEVLELREKVETYEAQVALHDTRVAQLRHEAEDKVGIVAQLQRQIAEQRTMVEQHATESTLAQQKMAELATLAKQREEECIGAGVLS